MNPSCAPWFRIQLNHCVTAPESGKKNSPPGLVEGPAMKSSVTAILSGYRARLWDDSAVAAQMPPCRGLLLGLSRLISLRPRPPQVTSLWAVRLAGAGCCGFPGMGDPHEIRT